MVQTIPGWGVIMDDVKEHLTPQYPPPAIRRHRGHLATREGRCSETQGKTAPGARRACLVIAPNIVQGVVIDD